MASLCLAQQPEADALLSSDPLALLIGMVLDQQIPLEHAFTGPLTLTQRLGHQLDVKELADYDPEALAKVFAKPPAIHRFPASMAGRVQELCRIVVTDYDGDPASIWTTAKNGAELRKRIEKLPGFGKHKAAIFTALLGKQYGVTPRGWREAAGEFGKKGSLLSVADITDQASLLKVREYKKQMKAAAKTKAPK
ncbi:MAG TPA: HhH-GPD-type base excision DNA repair protein [Mycobacteriales bacterium]|nr:HhH-GPD-type base excision DNA repair protein [Mycobacteriales bacterium]